MPTTPTPAPWRPTTHDRTPWSRNWQCVLDADGRVILAAEEGGPRKGERATYHNAARAVACVNALDGVADPAAALAEVRAILARLADCYEEQCTCGATDARAVLALLGGAR